MKKIGVISLNHDTFNNPTILGILQFSKQKDIKYLFFVENQSYSIPDDVKDIVEVYHKPHLNGLFSRNPKRLGLAFIDYISILYLLKKHKVSTLIGVDPMGFILSTYCKRILTNIFLGYLSFEIVFSDEGSSFQRKLRKLELIDSKLANFVLIQDECRKDLLTENKYFKNATFFYIPVSPLPIDTTGNNASSIRKKLEIAPHQIAIIYSGSIAEWAGIKLLIELVDKMYDTNDYVFVVHSRHDLGSSYYEQQLKELASKNNTNLILHDSYFANNNDYADFLSAFDIGLVLYTPKTSPNYYDGKNIINIGLASGKFSFYSMVGLAIVATKCSYYQQLNSKYSFGLLFDNVDELVDAMKGKKLPWKQFKRNSLNMYKEIINPTKQIENLVMHLI